MNGKQIANRFWNADRSYVYLFAIQREPYFRIQFAIQNLLFIVEGVICRVNYLRAVNLYHSLILWPKGVTYDHLIAVYTNINLLC